MTFASCKSKMSMPRSECTHKQSSPDFPSTQKSLDTLSCCNTCFDVKMSQGTAFPTRLHVNLDQPAHLLSAWTLATHRMPCRDLDQTCGCMPSCRQCCAQAHIVITKTCLFKYIENFTPQNWKFSDKKLWYFSYFCSKHRLWVLVRTASRWGSSNGYPQSMFWAEIRKNNTYHCKRQFYYIKVGFKGIKIK